MTTPTVPNGPCDPWPLDPACLPAGWPADPAGWDPAQRSAVETASEILNRLTAGVYGLCTIKIRPCRRRCSDRNDALRYGLDGLGAVGSGLWSPALIDGRMYNIPCGCSGECGCSPLCEVILDRPVTAVTQVKVDGVMLNRTAYRVDDNRKLVRVDGECWPWCQELAKPDTAPNTFSITYQTGVPVPAGGRMAVTELAVQVWKACHGGKSCALSDRVTQVVREGITYTLDNIALFERGRTGIVRVDLWLASVNPYSARLPMRAWSPDTVRSRRTTWEAAVANNYVHTQSTPDRTWVIHHGLGWCPGGVRVQLPDGSDLYGGDVECMESDPNTLTISYGQPYAGTATLS